MSTTKTYEAILEAMVQELPEIERKILDALRANESRRLTRQELVRIVFNAPAYGNLSNSTKDRKVRLTIAALRDKLVPIVATSGEAGYRLDYSEENAEKMANELESRANDLNYKAALIRRAILQEPVNLDMVTAQVSQLSLFESL